MKVVIANINIEIPTPGAKTDEDAELIAKNYELPHGYVSDSFELVKVIEEEREEPFKKFTVTLTTTIKAEDERDAINLFMDKDSIDYWNTGENIEAEEEVI